MDKRKVRNPRFLEKYIKMLDIRWDVKTFLVNGITSFMINSNESSRKHLIYVPPQFYQPSVLPGRIFQWVHELAHAHLCEKVDRLFAKTHVSQRYKGNGAEWHKEQYRKLYDCVTHVDIWADEKMAEIDPALAENNTLTFFDSYRRCVDRGETSKLECTDAWICLAMSVAQDLRAGKDGRRGMEFIKVYDLSSRDKIQRLIGIYSNMPRISYNAAQDLRALEESAQAVAALLRVGFVPRLVKEQGKHVWLVD